MLALCRIIILLNRYILSRWDIVSLTDYLMFLKEILLKRKENGSLVDHKLMVDE